LQGLLDRLRFQPVFTAHPTEAKRRTLLEAQRRLAKLASRLDDPGLGPTRRSFVEQQVLNQIQALWKTDDIVNFKDDFFDNAPVGKIFSAAAENIKYQPLGAHAGEFGNAIGNALVSIEQGKATPDAAWQKAVADIKNIAG